MNEANSPRVGNGTPVTDSTVDALELGAFDPAHDPNELPPLDAGMIAVLVVRGPNAGARYLLDEGVTTVGRHQESRIFLDDVTVSRRHAQFVRTCAAVTLEDSGSLNGTYVNGERVETVYLNAGDELQVGRFKLVYVTEPTAVDHTS